MEPPKQSLSRRLRLRRKRLALTVPLVISEAIDGYCSRAVLDKPH